MPYKSSSKFICKLKRLIIVLPLLAATWALPALAQQTPAPALQAKPSIEGNLPPAVVAIIDYQKILRDSKAASSIRSQVDARRSSYQDEISKKEQSLRDQDQALVKQRTVLSAEAFAAKRRSFEQDVAQVQKDVQNRRRQLDEVTAIALNSVREAIIQVVSELAESKGFNLVVPSSAVLVFSPKIDVTQDVLVALDQRLPDVKVADAAPVATPQQ